MTTIKFGKNMNINSTGAHDYYVTIYTHRIEENQTKEFFNYNMPDLDGSSEPTEDIKTRAQDYKMIKRIFTISGEIDAGSAYEAIRGSSIEPPKSVYDVRDLLTFMNLFSGPIKFFYGIPEDYSGKRSSGYIPHPALGYFKSDGEEVLFSRLRFEEQSADFGEYNSSSTAGSPVIERDYLVEHASDSYNLVNGTGSPKYGTYNLPSKLSVEIECMIIKIAFD